ncbi:hypothetical protein ATERTT37_001092 [Aspergillus terreus]
MHLLSRHRVVLSLLCLQTLPHLVLSACYFPDGTKADASYQPCNPSASESACCALNKTNGALNDICLDNGLCYSQDSVNSGLIFQNACTKQSWGTAACPKYCPVGGSSDGYFVLPCPGAGKGFWCCSDSGNDCCSGGAFSLSMPALSVSPTTTSTAGTATTSASTTTTTTTATTPATTTGGNDDGHCEADSPSATAVGAGMGVALAVCLAGALAALYFQRRMYRRQLLEHKERLAAQYVLTPTYPSPAGLYPSPVELNSSGKAAIYELGDSRRESRQRF